MDVELRDKAFDGWIVAENKLFEVKTGMFYSTMKGISLVRPAVGKFLEVLKAKAIYDYYDERIRAGSCQIDFGFGLRDPLLIIDIKSFFHEVGATYDEIAVFNNGC